jgi:hypothetical protein
MKTVTLKRAKKRAYEAFQKWYRRKATYKKGWVKCYTCGKPTDYENIQVGHWMTGHTATNYINIEYVRPQCSTCNIVRNGEQGLFWEKIEKEIGTERFMYLRQHSKDVLILTVPDYLELERIYLNKLKGLIWD